MIELWNIAKKPSLDIAAFVALLDSFPNKFFLANVDNNVSEMHVGTADLLTDFVVVERDPQNNDDSSNRYRRRPAAIFAIVLPTKAVFTGRRITIVGQSRFGHGVGPCLPDAGLFRQQAQ